MFSRIRTLLIALHPFLLELFTSQLFRSEVTWVIYYFVLGCFALFRRESECQYGQGRNFLQRFSIRTGCGHSSSSCVAEAGCPAAKNTACPWRAWDYEHVCIVSETFPLVFSASENSLTHSSAPGRSPTLTRPPPPNLFLPFSLSLLLPMSSVRRTDSLDLITDQWRSPWTSHKMVQT